MRMTPTYLLRLPNLKKKARAVKYENVVPVCLRPTLTKPRIVGSVCSKVNTMTFQRLEETFRKTQLCGFGRREPNTMEYDMLIAYYLS
jgi:hypothetical protein